MARAKRQASTTRTRGQGDPQGQQEPNIYQQLLAEAGVATSQSSSERPLKRRKPSSQRGTGPGLSRASNTHQPSETENDTDESEDAEFQDVVLPAPTMQTMELDSDDEDEDEDADLQFEDIVFQPAVPEDPAAPDEGSNLELNLTAQKASFSPSSRQGQRRKPMSNDEKQRRVHIHQAHLVCFLAHVARRNHWCNDATAQRQLRAHLTDKTINYLKPGAHLPQFGQSESLKNGLKQALAVWKTKFVITERGLRRALWAEDPEHLQHYELPTDMDSCLDGADFREASKKLQGSRDVGAQLFCALLRSLGVRARLVCSLQPLSFTSAGPTLPKSTKPKPVTKVTQKERTKQAVAQYAAFAASAGASKDNVGSPSTARRRLGHPNASNYDFQPSPAPPKPQRVLQSPAPIRESAHPVFWVEVLDRGYQKWQPVDPVVTHSFFRVKVFEPPITDKENCLSYVVAFDADGTAKDVTRRYAKAYTAKTRRLRVETALKDDGEWWRKVMIPLRKRRPSDLEQIEDSELADVEAREPMPRDVQDFKDHPVYALERHMRRCEVLIPGAKPSGTIGAGSRGSLEKIYRRRDVRVAKSADKWYRLGREVKPNEIPAKWLPKKSRPRGWRFGNDNDKDDGDGDGVDGGDSAGTPIYTIEQTDLYEPPPVRNGRVPKNKFGNIDAYVPSMIPRGAVHLVHEHAARAAFLAGVDYAPALTGFQFKGQHGTAVLSGIVVAQEFEAAVRAVIDGMADAEQELEDEKRRLVALRMWRRLLMSLRIRERIWSGVDEAERKEADREAEMEAALADAESDVTDEYDVEVEEEGGGFLLD